MDEGTVSGGLDVPLARFGARRHLQHAVVASRSELAATIDSALHIGALADSHVGALLASLPAGVRPIRSDLDGRSMSGTESHLRFALRSAGYRVEPQARIRDVGYVGLLVDGWFIVECDSKAHHGELADQNVGRKRDGNAAMAGLSTARFSYAQVMYERDWCLRVVEAGLLRGRPVASMPADRGTPA